MLSMLEKSQYKERVIQLLETHMWKNDINSGSKRKLREVRVTRWIAAYQAPPSMRFSRQEYWSGVPLPSPFNGAKDPVDCSLPGYSIHGSFQARVLEWSESLSEGKPRARNTCRER